MMNTGLASNIFCADSHTVFVKHALPKSEKKHAMPVNLAANPGCSITMVEIHLAASNRLFKQTEPALGCSSWKVKMTTYRGSAKSLPGGACQTLSQLMIAKYL